MAAQNLIAQAWALLQKGRHEEAEGLMHSIVPQTVEEKRQLGHLQAKVLLHKGNVDSAQEILFETYLAHGPHLTLLSDLATCLYHQRDWTRLQAYVARISTEVEKARGLVNPENLAATIEIVSKFQEELGDLDGALRLMKSMDVSLIHPTQQGTFLANKLRLTAELGLRREIEEAYAEVLHFSKAHAQYTVVETQHALMWAESELLGFEQALFRYQQGMTSPFPWDQNLFAFDLMDISIRAGCRLPPDIELPSPQDPFEKALLQIYEGSGTFDFIKSMSCELSPGQFLKLLSHCQEDPRAAQLLSLCMARLSGASKKIWSRKIKATTKEETISLFLDGDVLKMSSIIMNLQRKQNHLALISAFIKSTRYTTEELAKQMGANFYDESQKDRIRTAVQRLNQDFLKLTGHKMILAKPNGFELNKIFLFFK